MKCFIAVLILLSGSVFNARADESCRAFYKKPQYISAFYKRTKEMIPFLGLGKKIQRLAAEELKVRRGLSKEQIEERQENRNLKNLSKQGLFYGALNYLSNDFFGIWGFFPTLDLLHIKKLSNQDLELLSMQQLEVTNQKVLKYFGTWKPLVHETIRLWSAILIIHTATLVANPQELQKIQMGFQTVMAMSTSHAKIETIQKESYPEHRIRQLALEKWTESFRISEHRNPDPVNNPEDKAEWEKIFKQIQQTPIDQLRISYSLKKIASR